jgi:hypothetical protein
MSRPVPVSVVETPELLTALLVERYARRKR